MTVLAIVQCWNKEDPVRGFTVSWIEALADEAGRVVVLALEKRHDSTNSRVEVLSLGKESYAGFWRYFYYLLNWHRAMSRIMRDVRPDIVFTHMAPVYSVLAYPYARLRGVPVITWFTHPRGSLVLRLAHALSARVVSVSRHSYPYPDGKLIAVGHGIDTDFFTPASHPLSSPPLLVCAGRVSSIKNIRLLLNTVSLLASSGIIFKLAILGSSVTEKDRAYKKDLEHFVVVAGLGDSIRFIPAVSASELRDWYRCATLQINCTESGSSDKVILEGMACGTPCIAVAPAFKDAFGNYATLLSFVPPDAAQITERIRTVLAMPGEEYSALRAAMQHGVQISYSLPVFCRKLVHILTTLKKE